MEKQPIKDDGRTIANMNVPGMPWYSGVEHNRARQNEEEIQGSFQKEPVVLTRGEKKAIIKGVMSAILPLILAFGIGYFLIFLFLDLVWLR
nr:hypothetical protein [uncultured Niameybacter sp.]